MDGKNLNKNSTQRNLDLIKIFLENQTKELINASSGIELEKVREKNAYDYSCKALEAQARDRKEQRVQIKLFIKWAFIFVVVVIFLLSVLAGICIYTGHAHLIISALKIIAYIAPTSVGSYLVGFNRGKKSSQSTEI